MSKQSKQANSESKTAITTKSSRAENTATGCNHDEVRQLAYTYWQARGCPEGSPEKDWLQAVHQLNSRTAAKPAKRAKAQLMAASN